MFDKRPLSHLAPGWQARVSSLCAQGSMRRRLQDLGVIPGAAVECLARSPLKDPCAYLIQGAVIALRNADAASILVREASPAQRQSAKKAAGRQEAGYGTL